MRTALIALAAAACALAQTAPRIAGCDVFPTDNIWNVPVDTLPVAADSATLIRTVGATRTLHPDFGTGNIGIPYSTVNGSQSTTTVSFDYDDESDAGPYPIPPNPPIEESGDRHILILERDHCILYELFDASRDSGGHWHAGSGAIFDLTKNTLRPDTWTSADAAGLPILPGLVRYDEVAAGEIRHAIRFTVPDTRRTYVWPATHQASDLTGAEYPCMGERFRLRADYDTSTFPADVQVILRALKKYGMILADNGTQWYLTGAPDDRWNDETLHELHRVTGADLEAVDTSALQAAAGSAQVRRASFAPPVVNAASYRTGGVAPGELISIFGANLGPAGGVPLQLDPRGFVDTSLGGTEVLFDGVPAPMLYVRRDQVNAVVPYAVAGKSSTALTVRANGVTVYSEPALDVHTATPGILTRDASGKGEGAILNQDYGINSPANPAARGSVIMIYAVGAGQTVPSGTDGKLGGTAPPVVATGRVTARIGGVAAEVTYAGGSRDLVAGVLQVNVRVPVTATPGDALPIQLSIDGLNSQPGVTVAIR